MEQRRYQGAADIEAKNKEVSFDFNEKYGIKTCKIKIIVCIIPNKRNGTIYGYEFFVDENLDFHVTQYKAFKNMKNHGVSFLKDEFL